MKKLVIIVLAVGVTALVSRSFFAPSVRAQSVEKADTELARTERDLRSAIAATTDKANALQTHLMSNDGATRLPEDVREFETTTKRLRRLQDELRQDIDEFQAATTRTLERFDRERTAITDPITRHAMTSLRVQAKEHTAERLAQARASLVLLNRVLIQGRDVLHTVNCVTLAEQLQVTGQAIDEHVSRATHEATLYTTMTNDLLATLTSPSE